MREGEKFYLSTATIPLMHVSGQFIAFFMPEKMVSSGELAVDWMQNVPNPVGELDVDRKQTREETDVTWRKISCFSGIIPNRARQSDLTVHQGSTWPALT